MSCTCFLSDAPLLLLPVLELLLPFFFFAALGVPPNNAEYCAASVFSASVRAVDLPDDEWSTDESFASVVCVWRNPITFRVQLRVDIS